MLLLILPLLMTGTTVLAVHHERRSGAPTGRQLQILACGGLLALTSSLRGAGLI